MASSERTQEMLRLIDSRLAAHTANETIERLHAYGGSGPSIIEFEASLTVGRAGEPEVALPANQIREG